MLRHLASVFFASSVAAFQVPTPETILTLGASRPHIYFDSDLPTIEAGFVMTLTQKFFDDYNMSMMQVFKQKMSQLSFRDNCLEQSLGELIKAKLCVSD